MPKFGHCWLAIVLVFILGACSDASQNPGVATAGSGPSGGTAPAAGQEERRRQLGVCMSAEGVEIDTSSDGKPVPRGDVNPEKVNAALEKCRQYLPDGGEPVRLSPEDIEKMRLYAQCIRDRGVPDYPDPNPLTGETSLTAEQGRKLKDDPKLAAAMEACRHQLPAGGAREPGVSGGGIG